MKDCAKVCAITCDLYDIVLLAFPYNGRLHPAFKCVHSEQE